MAKTSLLEGIKALAYGGKSIDYELDCLMALNHWVGKSSNRKALQGYAYAMALVLYWKDLSKDEILGKAEGSLKHTLAELEAK